MNFPKKDQRVKASKIYKKCFVPHNNFTCDKYDLTTGTLIGNCEDCEHFKTPKPKDSITKQAIKYVLRLFR